MRLLLVLPNKGMSRGKIEASLGRFLSTKTMQWNNGNKTNLPCLYIYKNLPPAGVLSHLDTIDHPTKDDKGWLLGTFIPPNDQIYRNNSTSARRTELVAVYRHKRYERCIALLIASKPFENLNSVCHQHLLPKGAV